MVSCEETVGTDIPDSRPGTLVWVRRRNGSWWPGIILSNKELPPKLRNSHRSGTPIKLLGREDGSIDWYNLGKTVRVKAFRCGGEYDDIIDKAKSYGSQKHLKRYPNEGKYVRREDAILHALEIETAQKANPIPTTKTRNNSARQNGVKKKGALKKCRTATRKKSKNPNDYEEDVKTEGMQRMRDLREIGSKQEKNPKNKSGALEINPKNKNGTQEINPKIKSAAQEINPKNKGGAQEINPKNESEAQETNPKMRSGTQEANPNLVNEPCFQFGGVPTSSSTSSTKRKRSNMAQAYENMRKKHKSVPLSKLCDGTRVIIPSYCEWVGSKAFNNNHKENSINDKNNNNNNINGQDSSETSSRSTCNGRDLNPINGISRGYLENGSSDGFFNVPLVMGDVFEGDYPSAFGSSSYASEKHDTSISIEETKTLNPNSSDLLHDTNNQSYENNNTNNEETSYSESTESDHNSMQPNPDSDSESGNTILDEIPAFDSHCMDLAPVKEDEEEDEDPTIVKPLKSIPMETTLYDVELVVRTSYKGPHVPLVSLMSKVNSKPIVGHPITVQVLKDNSTLHLFSRKENSHHHRPSTSSINQLLKRDEKVISGHGKRSHKKGGSGSSKPWRKIASSNNNNNSRKMRRLSSITIDRRERRGERKLLVEKMSGMTVACVPLRLVFSRINEALKFPTRLENP